MARESGVIFSLILNDGFPIIRRLVTIDLIRRVTNFNYEIKKVPGRLMLSVALKRRFMIICDKKFIDEMNK